MTTHPPTEVLDRYLRAAEAAGEGRLDDAEAGLRRVVAEAPELATARFQLGQLLWVRGDTGKAIDVLAPLGVGDSSLAAYARAIAAAAGGDVAVAAGELEAGLALPQDNPALAADMRRLLDRCRDAAIPGTAVPRSLAAYGRQD